MKLLCHGCYAGLVLFTLKHKTKLEYLNRAYPNFGDVDMRSLKKSRSVWLQMFAIHKIQLVDYIVYVCSSPANYSEPTYKV